MIKTTVITVGKVKEEATRNLISEYEKRLTKYTDFTHIEVPDLPLSDKPNEKEIESVLKKEGIQILKNIPKNMVPVAMAINGKQYSSEEFAALIDQKAVEGGLCFIIGSSHGLHLLRAGRRAGLRGRGGSAGPLYSAHNAVRAHREIVH